MYSLYFSRPIDLHGVAWLGSFWLSVSFPDRLHPLPFWHLYTTSSVCSKYRYQICYHICILYILSLYTHPSFKLSNRWVTISKYICHARQVIWTGSSHIHRLTGSWFVSTPVLLIGTLMFVHMECIHTLMHVCKQSFHWPCSYPVTVLWTTIILSTSCYIHVMRLTP